MNKFILLLVLVCLNFNLASALIPTESVITISKSIKPESRGELIPVPEKPKSFFHLFNKKVQPIAVVHKKTNTTAITEKKVSASADIRTNIEKKVVVKTVTPPRPTVQSTNSYKKKTAVTPKFVRPEKTVKETKEIIKLKSEVLNEINDEKLAVKTVQTHMKYEVCALLSLPSLQNFNANSTIASVGNTTYLLGAQFNIYYPLTDNLYVGAILEIGQNSIARKVSTGVYKDVNVHYLLSDLIINWVLISDSSFSLESYAGLGIISGGYIYSYTDETQATSSFSKIRDGIAINTQLGANLRLKINANWDVGFGAAYLLGKISDMRRANEPDPTSPDLDFSGLILKVNSSINF
ncbi:MAG: hypothetical protein PHV30_08935 [Candidatus Margulisbacteria bacterium]|nr:hypothetical protein [Candidatus Margulisiibacteriota bacterium]